MMESNNEFTKPNTQPLSEKPSVTIRWINDEEVEVCTGCKLLFDWIRRKHHCRFCGNVYCDLCSNSRLLISKEQILINPKKSRNTINSCNPQRVCYECTNLLSPLQNELRSTNSNAVQATVIEKRNPNTSINNPVSLSLKEEIKKATYSIEKFVSGDLIKDQSIPLPLISAAKGLVFLTVIKAGVVVSCRMGTGLMISRFNDGSWSAPCAIGTAGIGWGIQVGGEITEFVIVLNTKAAVEAFCANGQVGLGAEVGIAAGPVGRKAAGALQASSGGIASCYSYSHSKGLFVGVSLEGSVLGVRESVNAQFYGKKVTVSQILCGEEPAPIAAQPLYDALRKVMESPANAINRDVNSNIDNDNEHRMPY